MGRLGGCLRTGYVCTPPLNRFGPSEFAQLFKYERDSKYKHKGKHATCRFLWVDTCFYQTAQKSRSAAFSYEFTALFPFAKDCQRLCSKFQRSSQLCESPIVTWSSWIARDRARASCYDFRGEEPIMAREFSNRASCRVDLVGMLVFQPYHPTKEIPILDGAAQVNGYTPPLSSPTRLRSLASNIPPYVRTVVERRQRRPIHCPSREYNTFVIPNHACRI